MAFEIDEIVSLASVVDYYDIPVTRDDIAFLYRSGAIAAARKLNEKLQKLGGEDNSTQYIRLKKTGGISVQEDAGLRGDRFNEARRLELTAEIGRATGCNEADAQKILVTESKWKELPIDLQAELSRWFLSYMAETTETSLLARRVTTIIQKRLIPDWLLEWTLQLPSELQTYFVEFINGETTRWAKPEPPLLSGSSFSAIDSTPSIEVESEPVGEDGSQATNGKRSRSAVPV